MAQNVTVAGASYSDVPSVELPKTGGGTASFTDVSDTTASASDVASGKYFYTAAGTREQGSMSVYNGAHHTQQPDRTVTVYLTNPVNASQFGSVSITNHSGPSEWDGGPSLGMITTATGSKTVQVAADVYGVGVTVAGVSPDVPSAGIACTGGVSLTGKDGAFVWFQVTGDGTITLDGIDYDD